jgi:hypothetical protein
MACALDLNDKIKAKEARRTEIQQDKLRKDSKRELNKKDSSFQRKKAQSSFNEFIRLRDKNLGCISCDKNKDWAGQWHAGHFHSVGARKDLRFNEDNCHKQCSVCNNYLSGNLVNYKDSLVEKIGPDRFQALIIVLKPEKVTATDYANIHAEYQQKIKELSHDADRAPLQI